jgi:hypothetical protein
MESTCAVAILFPLLIISVVTSQSNAQVVSSTRVLLRLAATESAKRLTRQVPFQTVAKGLRSGIRERSQIAIRNRDQWQALWSRHSSINANPSPPPAIDLDKEMVAAVFLGEEPTGGYGIEIVGAELTDSSLDVLFRETAPTPGAIVTQAFTQPFHIVRIELNGIGTVNFRRLP